MGNKHIVRKPRRKPHWAYPKKFYRYQCSSCKAVKETEERLDPLVYELTSRHRNHCARAALKSKYTLTLFEVDERGQESMKVLVG